MRDKRETAKFVSIAIIISKDREPAIRQAFRAISRVARSIRQVGNEAADPCRLTQPDAAPRTNQQTNDLVEATIAAMATLASKAKPS